jgi:acyl-CoA synthetase (AMP-forming)/AMP-acid ligase II
MVGILRAGFAVFPISPRNNPPAIAHLLKKTGATHLFVSADPVSQGLSSAAIELLQTAEASHVVTTSETPVFDDLFPPGSAVSSFKRFPPRRFDMDAPAVILHSAGMSLLLRFGSSLITYILLSRIYRISEADSLEPPRPPGACKGTP